MSTDRRYKLQFTLGIAVIFTLAGLGLTLRGQSVTATPVQPTINNVFPPGDMHDLVASSCAQCHAGSIVTSQHKTYAQWADTVRSMTDKGAVVPKSDFDKVVSYLAKNFADNRTAGPHTANFAEYQAIPGQPVQKHSPENPTVPAFAGQTRAPYRSSQPLKFTLLTDKLHNPWGLAFLPDGKFLITEKHPAAMRILDKSGALSAPLTGLAAVSRTSDFQLLDVALDPSFVRNHQIFFTFVDLLISGSGDKRVESNTYVARCRLNEASGELSDMKVIFRAIPEIPAEDLGLKTGGRIAIDKKGDLFITIGDRSTDRSLSLEEAQHLDNDLGKIIHITPDGKPAADNPFLGKAGVLPEIWAYGSRNGEGLAFRPGTQELWENEHGQRGGDELNLIEKGKNYGWPVIAYGIDYNGKPISGGITQKAGMEQPVYFWNPVIAPSGLAFYSGNLFPAWKDSAFIGGLRGLILDRVQLSGDKVVAEEGLLTDLYVPIRDVRVGPDGAVYVLTSKDSLLKLTPK